MTPQDPKPVLDLLSSGDALAILGLICLVLLAAFVFFGKKLLTLLSGFLTAMVREGREGNKALLEIKDVMREHLNVATEIREGTRTTVRQMSEWGESKWLKDSLEDMRKRLDLLHAEVMRQKKGSG